MRSLITYFTTTNVESSNSTSSPKGKASYRVAAKSSWLIAKLAELGYVWE